VAHDALQRGPQRPLGGKRPERPGVAAGDVGDVLHAEQVDVDDVQVARLLAVARQAVHHAGLAEAPRRREQDGAPVGGAVP
jgi:hypothetical protein